MNTSRPASRLSFILPIYNEAQNIPLVYDKIQHVMKQHKAHEYEIIAVNDGSRDDSYNVLKKYAAQDPLFKVINFRVNAGQTAALSAGINAATGDILIPLDSDLENDPHDVPVLLAKMDEGYDVVSGWRKDRWQKSFFTRRLPSFLANKLISTITGVKLHDYGCTLKAYKREVIQDVPLYGEMHRFIPAYASWQGAKVAEVPVHYAPRKFGKSNYGITRTFRVLLDLVLIKFLDRYMDRPIHFFGGIGLGTFLFGMLTGFVAVVLRLNGLHFVQTPLPVLTVFLWLTGVNLIGMGVIAEMLMRTYYESRGAKPYLIKNTLNL
jgi:glycosyltransferase involved in cell wall biosynthesis